jgi:hypothetical protein
MDLNHPGYCNKIPHQKWLGSIFLLQIDEQHKLSTISTKITKHYNKNHMFAAIKNGQATIFCCRFICNKNTNYYKITNDYV